MVTIINIDSELDYEKLKVLLQKGVSSGNLNFMIGSGCSFPAIATLGNIEEEVQDIPSFVKRHTYSRSFKI